MPNEKVTEMLQSLADLARAGKLAQDEIRTLFDIGKEAQRVNSATKAAEFRIGQKVQFAARKRFGAVVVVGVIEKINRSSITVRAETENGQPLREKFAMRWNVSPTFLSAVEMESAKVKSKKKGMVPV